MERGVPTGSVDWRGRANADASGHAVEVAVARTREALGGTDLIRTVYKRGYRLDVIDEEDG